MRRVANFCTLLMLLVGMTWMTERQAHAYADPGSSLLILQTVGSVITATGLFFRRRIAGFFQRGKVAEPESVATENPASPSAK